MVTVTARDSGSLAPVSGVVLINNYSSTGQLVHIQFSTNTSRRVTLRRRRVVTADATEYLYPEGVVSAPGYQSAQLDMGFP